MARNQPDIKQLIEKIKEGDRYALSRAITIIESERPRDREYAKEIMDACLQAGATSIRLGITGPPGVGKSVFIEKIGLRAIKAGYHVAVLAVDPTSNLTKGSILGDKTRMSELSVHDQAFIRPSPSAGHLGGVAAKTRESIRLCEAAGYDFIIVETVGVGQSEIAVKNITDCFILLLQPGSGDELQGIKRGIMELADIAIINKADGALLEAAIQSKKEFKRALHILSDSDSPWTAEVSLNSNLNEELIEKNWELIQNYFKVISKDNWKTTHRQHQQLIWFEELLKQTILDQFYAHDHIYEHVIQARNRVVAQELHPYRALELVFKGVNKWL